MTEPRDESLILLVHGEPKTGKSWLADTAPSPRLILDAENGSRFTPSRKTYWNPHSEEPPAPGEWESCVVTIRDFETLASTFAWLNSGKHPFRSVVLDSITEIQKRCKDGIIGTDDVVTERQWGQMLVRMERIVRDFRDLTMNPVTPIESVVLLALTTEKGGKFRPLIQGALGVSLPGFVDVIGYLAVVQDEEGQKVRRMLVAPHELFEAGDRTSVFEALGAIDSPNVEQMIQTMNTTLKERHQ